VGLFAPVLDKLSNQLDIVSFSGLKTSTVMKNKLFILVGSDLVIDDSLSRF
jgi:hypothetical protein